MNKMMNRSATSVLGEVDLILWLVIAGQWSKEDAAVLKRIKKCTCPVFVVVNQIDRCKDPTALLPYLSDLAERCQLNDYIPISSKTRDGLAQLQNKIDQALPQTDAFLFPEDQETNQSQSFRASEMIREKLFRSLGDELPYGLAVQIEYLTKEPKLTRIHAVIWVDKPNHKPMVIGKGGSLLKQIGSQARADIEHMLGQKVFLGLWVKVKSQWANNRQELHRLGYEDL